MTITRSEIVNFAAKSSVARKVASQRGSQTRRSNKWRDYYEKQNEEVRAVSREAVEAACDEAFRGLHGQVKARVELHAQALSFGKITPEEFEKAMRKEMREAYDSAARFGKAKARGKFESLSAADVRAVDKERREDYKFLKEFVADVRGKYAELSPEERDARIRWRAQMYADALQGEMNDSWAAHMPAGTKFDWVMSPAEHCITCREESAKSALTYKERGRVPGDGSTKCKTNCKCHLRAKVKGKERWGAPAVDPSVYKVPKGEEQPVVE
jgi:hypothetical protein